MKRTGDILVVDNYPPIVEFIADALTDDGYTVRIARDVAQAGAAIAERRPDLVLVDLHVPGTPGDTLALDLKNDPLGAVPVVIMTADARLARGLSIDGFAFCLTKPFELDELLDCVAAHIRA